MVHTPVIPNRHIVDGIPLEPDLEIVVLHDKLHKPRQEVLALLIGQTVDALDVVANAEDGLPAGDRVSADEGVDGLQQLAHVLGRATLGRVDLEVVALGGVVEERLGREDGQLIEEALERGRDTVVELVSRGPESVCTGRLAASPREVVCWGELCLPPPVLGN